MWCVQVICVFYWSLWGAYAGIAGAYTAYRKTYRPEHNGVGGRRMTGAAILQFTILISQ